MAIIENLNTPWNGHTGLEVESFIKSYLEQLPSKIGYTYVEETNEDNYLCCFADEASFKLWASDPDTNANLLIGGKQKLPSGGGASSAYSAKLVMVEPSNYQVATNTGKVKVKVKYYIDDDSIQEAGALISISKSTDMVNFTLVGNASIGYNTEEFIDISQYLDRGTTYIKLDAKGLISGATAGAAYSVLYAVVDQYCLASINPTIYNTDPFNTSFYVEGTSEKVLHYKVGSFVGSKNMGTSYNTQGEPIQINAAAAGLTHGVHTIESWLTFGANDTETEHRFCNFIYAPTENSEYIDKTPLFVVTSEPTHCSNWNKVTFFDYGVLNPTIDAKEFKICLSYDGTILDDYTTVITGQAGSFTTGTFVKDLRIDKSIVSDLEFPLQIRFFSGDEEVREPITLTVDNSIDFGYPYTANFSIDTNSSSISSGVGSNKKVYNLYELGNVSSTTASGWKAVIYNGEPIPALQLYAGSRIEIPEEFFNSNTGWKSESGQDCSITFAFDIMTNNIVNEDEAVISIAGDYNDRYTGIKIYPTKACVLSRNKSDESIADVGFREGVRTHIAVNIINNLRNTGLNYMRIYVNGILSREYRYESGDYFVPTIGTNGNIILGNTNADLTIFGMRVYKDIALESNHVLQDYKASMTFLDEKIAFNTANSIYDGLKIDYATCNKLGYNTLWYKIAPGNYYPQLITKDIKKAKGTELVVKIYDPETRELDVKHSGVFKGMENKGQGTTAKSYYWWNIQSDYADDKEIDESTYQAGVAEEMKKYGDAYATMYDEGQTIFYEDDGTYFEKKSYFNSEDGVSQVNSSTYEIEDGRGGITKLVGKANYASSMQSHKLGSIWFFDEMWQEIVNSKRKFYYRGKESNGPIHAACYEKPFLVFYTEGIEDPTEADAIFCGFQTWGSGKGDKQTFGYHKKDDCGYLCVSGADNDKILTLFQMPWNEDVIFDKSGSKPGYCYQTSSGNPLSFEVEIGDKSDDDEAQNSSEVSLKNILAPFISWVNSLSPFLEKIPEGLTVSDLTTTPLVDLQAAGYPLEIRKQYWDSDYNVYYYDPKTTSYRVSLCVPEMLYSDDADAIYYIKGSKNLSDSACDILNAQIKDARVKKFKAGTLLEQLQNVQFPITGSDGKLTFESFMTYWSDDLSDEEKNKLFVKARIQSFANDANKYVDIDDIILHQDVIKLLAGTDNRAKNTYYWMNPLGCKDNLIRLKGDDLDTILKTDNSGKQTKPYYIEEHDKDAEGKSYWNGENNVFYTLVERAFEKEMREMMYKIFETMASLKISVDDYFDSRYFFVQKYFPAVAYNETARLLYETAELYRTKGYTNIAGKSGKIDLAVNPMEQSLGSQLECEKEWLSKRLVMLYGYAQYGNFQAGEAVQDAFKFRTAPKRGVISGDTKSSYHIEFTPYQYLYPLMAQGKSTGYPKFDTEGWNGTRRVAKGETAIFEWSSDADTLCAIMGMSYCSSLGDMSEQPVAGNDTSLSGKRLTSFIGGNEVLENTHFRPNGITFTDCQNLESLVLTNSDNLSGAFTDAASNMVRLRELKLRGTRYTSVSLTATDRLETVELPSNLDSIIMTAQPNLTNFDIDSVDKLVHLELTACNGLSNNFENFKNTFLIPKFGESFKNTGTYRLKLNNVEWSDVEVKDLINFGEFCKTTELFKTTGKISNFINGSIKIKTCTEAEAWQLYDLFGIECFQPNANLHIYSNTEQIFLIGPSRIAEGSDNVKFEPLVLSANRKSIEYYVMYTKSDTTSSGMINLADINTVDSRLSAEIVGDYEVLEISAFENGAGDQKFTIYANHGSVTSSIGVTLTKRIYSGTFVIATEDGSTFVADGAQAIVLSGLDKIHELKVIEPEGDGKYIYSAIITGNTITKYLEIFQSTNTDPIIKCSIKDEPTRLSQGTLKVTCTKSIENGVSWTSNFPIVVQNENVAISSFTNPEIFSALANVKSEFITHSAILKTECQNFTDAEFAAINFHKEKPKSFDEFQYFTGLTTIAENKFQNCTELRSTILPANISDVGERAFFRCSSLTSITLPSNIKTIGNSAFEQCSSLSSVTWGANGAALTYLGNLAFKETALTTLFIPSGSNLSIGYGIVAGCSKLESFTGSYISEDGNILYKDNFIKGVTKNAFDNEGKLVVDPVWISANGGIDGYVFYNNNLLNVLDLSKCEYNMYFNTHSFDGSNISEIILVKNISIHLKDYSLANTSKMKKLTDFKLGVNSDTKHAFYNSSIEEIEITKANASFPKIDDSMFEKCKYLKTISYPDRIVSLGKNAFKGCSSLKEFTIKESISSIGEDCFDGCIYLSSIKSYNPTAPATVTYSFGQISSSSYAGFANRNKTDAEGNPYNKLFIPAISTGYLSDDKEGLLGWGILTNSTFGKFEINETL